MSVATQAHLRATTGEHDRFKHYVLARDLRLSILSGIPVEALCGKRWRPDANPERYPLCPTCAQIAHEEED